MKITHKVMTETDFIDDIICNKCGESCINEDAPAPEGLIEVNLRGGYGSKVLGDGDDFTFSLCETCLALLMFGFKLPPVYSDTLDRNTTFEKWKDWASSQIAKAA